MSTKLKTFSFGGRDVDIFVSPEGLFTADVGVRKPKLVEAHAIHLLENKIKEAIRKAEKPCETKVPFAIFKPGNRVQRALTPEKKRKPGTDRDHAVKRGTARRFASKAWGSSEALVTWEDGEKQNDYSTPYSGPSSLPSDIRGPWKPLDAEALEELGSIHDEWTRLSHRFSAFAKTHGLHVRKAIADGVEAAEEAREKRLEAKLAKKRAAAEAAKEEAA
jgi:hypothetical protein